MKKNIQYVAQYSGCILFLMLPSVGESIAAVVIGMVVSVTLLAAGGAFKFQQNR